MSIRNAFAVLVLGTLSASAAPIPAEQLAFFESKIRPVLVKHCYECHSSEAGKSKGGLLLDTREGIRTGGDRGPAVVPNDPVKSLLLTAIAHTDPDLEMPPKQAPLSKAIVADVEAWIKMGAPDPREPSGKTIERPPVDIKSGREFWAFKKPVEPRQPAPKNARWARRDLDKFVLAKLEENKLKPSPDAEPVTLLRRVYFDLIGLPPTQERVEAFVRQTKAGKLDAALEAEVDELLKSKHFGERWGRHWMDVARFAESNGRESNIAYPHAWRYRDYVINAFNADKPFDRFITEQLAGDLLPAKDDAERASLLIATSFLAFGAKGLNEMNRAQFDADVVDEQIDAVTRAVMASSVACARCHDHKYDPFAMEDYYAMAGIFSSAKTYFGTWIDSENNVGGDLIRLPELPEQVIPNKSIPETRVKQLKANLEKLNQEEKDSREYLKKAVAEGKDLSNEGYDMLRNAIRIYWSRGGIEGELETVDETGRALPLTMGVLEKGKVKDARLLERGELTKPGATIPRGFPRVVEAGPAKAMPKEQSGRLELSQWLTSPNHPLTSRVMVNRVWHNLFGSGLVRTVDNFGFTGERPSHPELLDHLALKFVKNGWSVKSMVRELVLSRTYRQASTYREDSFQADPENRFLWRANKRRLDAEVIRDSMLAVSGQLDPAPRKGSLVPIMNHSMSLIAFNKAIPADLDGSRHRSVYLPVVRDRLPDVLDIFDFAEPSLVSGDREVTNVPVQALYLMNSPFVQEQSAALARRVMQQATTTPDRVRRAFALCFNRPPDAAEMKLADNYFSTTHAGGEGAADEAKAWAGYCQALLASAEFRNAD